MNKQITTFVLSLMIGGELVAQATTLPELPRTQVDVTLPTVNGTTLFATCATMQAQINAAAALDPNLTHQIILATGTTCVGPYKLPAHTNGTGWILIKGTNYASLPPPGTRVSLSDAASMPQVKYGEAGVYWGTFTAMTGAQRYRIIGIDMVQDSSITPNEAFVVMGYNSQKALNTGYLIFDRCVLRDTDAAHSSIRGVWGDAQLGHTALIDSYVSGFKDSSRDTQAWTSINNPGPILIQNNFLEAAGENVMFGGAPPASDSVMPRDVTIKRNIMSKNPAWWGAANPVTKCLLELKLGQRVLIEGNDFLNMPWNEGGNAFRLTVRNENGSAPFADVSDVTICYNLASNVVNFIGSFGSDDQGPTRLSKHSKRWYIHDNLVYGLGWLCGGGASCGAFYSMQNGGHGCTDPTPTCKNEDITIAHNTVDDVHAYMFFASLPGQVGLDFRDNLINVNGGRGAFSPSFWGQNFLNSAFGSTWSWTNNRLAGIGGGENTSAYPQGANSYPASHTNFLWKDHAARDYTLQAGSPAKNAASDGTDQGVNFSAYNAARSGYSAGGKPNNKP